MNFYIIGFMEDKFKKWINKKIMEWVNTGRSETQFATEIGISQATLNAWKNGTRSMPKQAKIIDKLVSYFKDDEEVYELFDRPKFVSEDIRSMLLSSGLPDSFVDNLLAARAEYTKELSKRGISNNSSEARRIIKDALDKFGIQFTETE
jgi:transcriptional regulator with XRE-family HTH domain